MDVIHKSGEKRFEVALDEGTAVLEYTLRDKIMTLTHTYVPNAIRGRGVAGGMTAAALEYAREQNFNVVPLCSFAVTYIARQERRARNSSD